MRCLVKLNALNDQTYNSAYHVKLQGVLYRILEKAGYYFIHEEKPFKFVTFSNIFPPVDMEKGDERTWIIASPNEHLVESVSDTVYDLGVIEPGEQRYSVEYTSTFEITPEEEGSMETGTPIVVRIPAGRCKKYGIDPGDYDDVYWRLEHEQEAFVNEIEKNLASKYQEYHDEEPPERPYFTDYRPRKEAAVPVKYDDRTVDIIGTTWEFDYECETRPMYRIIKMAYSTGVGELNTTGFGFMNEI